MEQPKIYTVPIESLLTHGIKGAVRLEQRNAEKVRIMALFRDQAHARQVWDDWDSITQEGEDAHAYLNLIGDGRYCAV